MKHAVRGRHAMRSAATRAWRAPTATAVALILLGLAAPLAVQSLLPQTLPSASGATAAIKPLAPAHGPARATALPESLRVTGDWHDRGANAVDAAERSEPIPGLVPTTWAASGVPCASDDPYRTDTCYVTGTRSGGPPERMIFALGNSHTVQLGAALLEAVDRNPEWSMRTQAAPACPFTIVEHPSTPCEELWSSGTRYILEQQPDLVVLLATRSSIGAEQVFDDLADWVRMVRAETSSRVVVIRDSPRFDFDMRACAERRGTDSEACRAVDDSPQLDAHRLTLELAGAAYIDLNGRICPEGVCRPVVGGVWTYMDDNHLNADFWRTLAGALAVQLHSRVDWWPENPYLGKIVPRSGEAVAPVV